MRNRSKQRGMKTKVTAVTLGLAVLTFAGPGGGQVGAQGATVDKNDVVTVPGEASADAGAFQLGLLLGDIPVGLAFGHSVSGYRGSQSHASALAIDAGALPTILGAAPTLCDGSPAFLHPDTLNRGANAISSDPGGGASRRAEAFMPGSDPTITGASVGFQDATALGPLHHAVNPRSVATTENQGLDFGLMGLTNAQSTTTTEIVDGHRVATATVTADEMRILDVFRFDNVRWEAIARSGPTDSAEGSFTFESGMGGGVEYGPDQVDDLHAAFKTWTEGATALFSFFGVTFKTPQILVTDITDSTGATVGQRVEVTPIALEVVDMPLGQGLIRPIYDLLAPEMERVRLEWVEQSCTTNLITTVLDLVLGLLIGNGGLTVTMGGVNATTAATVTNLPRTPPTTVAPPPTTLRPTVTTSRPVVQSGGVNNQRPSRPATVAGAAAPVAAEATPVTTAPTENPSVVAAPVSADGSKGGIVLLIALLGVAGALCLAFGDRMIIRRNSRRIEG